MTSVQPMLVLFAGVGGQGVLTAARLLGNAVHRRGLPVVVSQLHGLSQRGGSVQAATRVGSAELLPPDLGSIDVLVGFELLETARLADRLDGHSVVLCNRWLLPPATATLERTVLPTPEALCAQIERRAGRCHFLDATTLAQRAGALARLNILFLGALTRLDACPVAAPDLRAALQGELDQRIFDLGQEALSQTLGFPFAQ